MSARYGWIVVDSAAWEPALPRRRDILDTIHDVDPSDNAGCHECLELGDPWVHLRMCQTCGRIGCCDDSEHRHATAHYDATQHPLIRSYEPGEDWYWCYVDEVALEISGSPPAPSHP